MKRFIYQAISLMLILSVMLLTAACGKTDPPRTEESTTAEEPKARGEIGMQEKLENMLKQYAFSGVFIVSKNGKVLCEAANGTLRPDGSDPITVDNLFAIASVSKQFCAACVLLLREEGKLDLNDTLDRYYPEYPAAKDITLKQMLTMRSGIPDYVSNGAGFDAYIAYDFGDTATEEGNHQAVRDWLFAQPLLFQPGTQFSYSDSNYFLLAEIVERISGERYGDYLREHIFAPLGMNDTGVCEELARSDRLAPPVSDGEERHKEITTIGATFGNGGIITTAADMDKWLTSLRENSILSEACFKEMTTDESPDGAHYGYGIFVNADGSLYHDGACDSYASFAYTIPKEGYNFFIVTNNVNAGFSELIREIMKETLSD